MTILETRLTEALQDLLNKCCDKTVGELDLSNEDEEFGALMAVGHIFRSREGKRAYKLLELIKSQNGSQLSPLNT